MRMDVGVKRLVLICPSEEVQKNVRRVLPEQPLRFDNGEVPESSYEGTVTVQVVLDADLIVDLI